MTLHSIRWTEFKKIHVILKQKCISDTHNDLIDPEREDSQFTKFSLSNILVWIPSNKFSELFLNFPFNFYLFIYFNSGLSSFPLNSCRYFLLDFLRNVEPVHFASNVSDEKSAIILPLYLCSFFSSDAINIFDGLSH